MINVLGTSKDSHRRKVHLFILRRVCHFPRIKRSRLVLFRPRAVYDIFAKIPRGTCRKAGRRRAFNGRVNLPRVERWRDIRTLKTASRARLFNLCFERVYLISFSVLTWRMPRSRNGRYLNNELARHFSPAVVPTLLSPISVKRPDNGVFYHWIMICSPANDTNTPPGPVKFTSASDCIYNFRAVIVKVPRMPTAGARSRCRNLKRILI